MCIALILSYRNAAVWQSVILFTGCKKTVPYINPEKLISVIEEDFDIEESSDYEENSFHVSRRDISSECMISSIVVEDTGLIKINYELFGNK